LHGGFLIPQKFLNRGKRKRKKNVEVMQNKKTECDQNKAVSDFQCVALLCLPCETEIPSSRKRKEYLSRRVGLCSKHKTKTTFIEKLGKNLVPLEKQSDDCHLPSLRAGSP
jgi:hypothetical protein